MILVDLRLPDCPGTDVVKQLKPHKVLVLVVIVTTFPDLDSSFDAATFGAAGYIDGPLFGDDLLNVVTQALNGHRPLRHPARASESVSGGFPLNAYTDSRVCQVVQMVDADPTITTDQLASQVALSESRLRHLFAETLGTSLSHFQRSRRLQLGARLLASTHHPVGQIGLSLRINDFKGVSV